MSVISRLASLLGMTPGRQQSGVPFANRNLFVDGRFDFWNNVSGSMSQTGGYTVARMWIGSCGAGGAGTFSLADARTTPSIFDSSPRQVFLLNMTTGSTGNLAARTLPFLVQKIEGGNTLSARSATLSVKLYTITAGQTVTIPAAAISQNFGSGGSPSAAVILDKTLNWTVTNTPTRFSCRVDLPSTSGKTFGSNNDDCLSIGLWFPGGVYSIAGSEFQLEISDPNASDDRNGAGGAPTTFEYRGQQQEFARTTRYYDTIASYNACAYTLASNFLYNTIQYKMRIAPTVTFFGGAPTNASAIQFGNAGTDGGEVFFSATATGPCAWNNVSITMDARL
jgi:hypothetical protein